MAATRLPVLATVADSLALMWRHLVPAILLTAAVTVPVEWAVQAAGLHGGGDAPLALVLATLISVATTAWLSAAYLRLVAVREAGGQMGLATALFEVIDALPWLLLNLLAVTVALLAAMAVVGGAVAAVVVTTILPMGLLQHPGGVGLVVLLVVLVVAGGGAAWVASLAVRWSLVTPVVVLEGRRWGLERSGDLTRGQRWRCLQVMAMAGALLSMPTLLFLGVAVATGGGTSLVQGLASGGGPATQALFGFTGLLFVNTGYRLFTVLAGGDEAVEAATVGVPPEGSPLQVATLEADRHDDPGGAADDASHVGGHEADEAAEPPADCAAGGDADEEEELPHAPSYDRPSRDLSPGGREER